MSIEHNQSKNGGKKNADDIYKILGIDPNVHSASYNPDSNFNAIGGDSKLIDDPYAPSGSIFDNYSNYNDNDPGYWRFYRATTITGIATVVLFVLVVGFGDQIMSLFSSRSTAPQSYDYAEEMFEAYEEPDYNEPAFKADGTYYFAGTISPKSEVHMKLDFANRTGRYYYTKYGMEMELEINSLYPYGDGWEVSMIEYNDAGTYTGQWTGTISADGDFKGTGEFLGKSRPFELNMVPRYDTHF